VPPHLLEGSGVQCLGEVPARAAQLATPPNGAPTTLSSSLARLKSRSRPVTVSGRCAPGHLATTGLAEGMVQRPSTTHGRKLRRQKRLPTSADEK
jgi:hypothetical protein